MTYLFITFNELSELNKGLNTEATTHCCSVTAFKNQRQPLADGLQNRGF